MFTIAHLPNDKNLYIWKQIQYMSAFSAGGREADKNALKANAR